MNTDATSFLPTTKEVADAVHWVRENPAMAIGVGVGITAFTVAKLFEATDEYEEDEGDVDASVNDQASAAAHKQPDEGVDFDPCELRRLSLVSGSTATSRQDDSRRSSISSGEGRGSERRRLSIDSNRPSTGMRRMPSVRSLRNSDVRSSLTTGSSEDLLRDRMSTCSIHHHAPVEDGKHGSHTEAVREDDCTFCETTETVPAVCTCDRDWGWFVPTSPANSDSRGSSIAPARKADGKLT